MQDNSDQLTWKDVYKFFDGYWTNLLSYYRLPLLIFATLLTALVLIYVLVRPIYTAKAVIGPPNPSPIKAMMASMGTGGALGLSRLAGAVASGNNDPFQEYQQLLNSSGISVALAAKDQFLQRVFYRRWDEKTGRWIQPDSTVAHFIQGISAGTKAFLHRPVFIAPGVPDLQKYLTRNLVIEPVKAPGASLSAFGSVGAGYIELSFPAETPAHAQSYLMMVLDRADTIIREEQLHDVQARIAYIKNELPAITDIDQRTALVQTLANQEELKTMMVADKRYAYVLVSAPYASPVPTSPIAPITGILLSLGISIFFWFVVVLVEPRLAFVQKRLRWLKRSPRKNDYAIPL
jgi:hypothetical protein